jgi:hypothetical protein
MCKWADGALAAPWTQPLKCGAFQGTIRDSTFFLRVAFCAGSGASTLAALRTRLSSRRHFRTGVADDGPRQEVSLASRADRAVSLAP